MITNEVLKTCVPVIRNRGRESYQDCQFHTKTGNRILAAQYRGRYQAYWDVYYLIDALMNTTKKGGD